VQVSWLTVIPGSDVVSMRSAAEPQSRRLPARNESGSGDREIGTPDAEVRGLVVSAREDIQIAHQTRAILTA
jgi:hypothetical protein